MSNTVKTEHKLSWCNFFIFFNPTEHVTQSHFTATLVNVMQVFPLPVVTAVYMLSMQRNVSAACLGYALRKVFQTPM